MLHALFVGLKGYMLSDLHGAMPVQSSSLISYHGAEPFVTPFPLLPRPFHSGVKRLARLGMVPGGDIPGMGALDMEAAEGRIVSGTREVVPGMVLCGMELAEVDGSPRMGPTFGAMIVSGRRAAHVALAVLEKRKKAAAGAKGNKAEAAASA